MLLHRFFGHLFVCVHAVVCLIVCECFCLALGDIKETLWWFWCEFLCGCICVFICLALKRASTNEAEVNQQQ